MPSSVHPVTFRSLLRYESGFADFAVPNRSEDDYASVQGMVEKGPDSSKVGTVQYCNTCYDLLRVLIAYLIDGLPAYEGYEIEPDAQWGSDGALVSQLRAGTRLCSYRIGYRG